MCPGETNSREHLSDFSPSSRDQAYRQRQAPGPPASRPTISGSRRGSRCVWSLVPCASRRVRSRRDSSQLPEKWAGRRAPSGGVPGARTEKRPHAGARPRTGRRGEACGCRRRVRLCPVSCPDPEKRMWVHTPEIPGAGTYRQPCVQALRVRVSTAGRRYGPFALGVRTPRLSLSLRTQEHPGALPRPLLRR